MVIDPITWKYFVILMLSLYFFITVKHFLLLSLFMFLVDSILCASRVLNLTKCFKKIKDRFELSAVCVDRGIQACSCWSNIYKELWQTLRGPLGSRIQSCWLATNRLHWRLFIWMGVGLGPLGECCVFKIALDAVKFSDEYKWGTIKSES